MPRRAWVVVISVEVLLSYHHRLVMICAIKSSRDFARLGGPAGGLGFAAAFAGAVFANWGAAAGFSNRAGMARSALCVVGGSAVVWGVAGSGALTGTPSGSLAAALTAGAGSAAATTGGGSAGGGGGSGGRVRSRMAAARVWSCFV